MRTNGAFKGVQAWKVGMCSGMKARMEMVQVNGCIAWWPLNRNPLFCPWEQVWGGYVMTNSQVEEEKEVLLLLELRDRRRREGGRGH